MRTSGESRHGGAYRHAKRALDVAAVLALAPLWLPALALSALAVRLSSGAPVLFAQERGGLRGRVFRIFKLKTMRDGSEPDEERITPIGRLLRATGLDELPQLLNVLRGEMSIVGPRPLLAQYLQLYSSEQMRRHDVLPGLTGLAQVNGRNAISWEEKFALDVEYARRQSLWLDASIVAKTLFLLISAPFRRHSPSERIMPLFKG